MQVFCILHSLINTNATSILYIRDFIASAQYYTIGLLLYYICVYSVPCRLLWTMMVLTTPLLQSTILRMFVCIWDNL